MRYISLLLILILSSLYGEKIREVANVIGVRDNQLIGYGIVVGLNGTGDGSSSKFTLQSLSNLLQTVNVKINPEDIKSKNIAAVFVTAKLPPFSRQGDRVDAVISSIGDAKSLEGGTLLMTPLKGVDGDIYALAQGSLTIRGANKDQRGSKSHTTSGSVLNGALIEREISNNISNRENIALSLNESNFLLALDIQKTINDTFGGDVAIALDSRTINMKKPADEGMIEFLANVLELEIPYEKEEKIVIDQKTGTVVAGINIKIEPVVITHGTITLKIDSYDEKLFDKEDNEDDEDGTLNFDEDMYLRPNVNTINIKDGKITVANVARALNRLGATPSDVIAILENIKRAGAIRAKLEIM